MIRDSSKETKALSPVVPNTDLVIAYRKYFHLWINLAKTFAASDDQAKDIVHGIISSILSNTSKRFASIEHIRNYVARSVLNRAMQAKQRDGRTSPWSDVTELQFAVTPEEIEREEQEQRQALKEILQRLPRNDHEIIKLRFYSGLTFREISELLRLPISTLKSREDAAVKRIRKRLRKKGF